MDTGTYLKRIQFHGNPASEEALFRLHMQHIFNVPFENLSIHCGEQISLDKEELFTKVVARKRGGFCYELNYLFHILLQRLGFSSTLVSARIYNDGVCGPEFDHLSLIVTRHGRQWLLDVGFGDLFLKPLALAVSQPQTDGRNYFKIEAHGPAEYVLMMSADQQAFDKKYIFDLTPRHIGDFSHACLEKQRNPDSYFVKNLVCTKPLPEGRVTLFNDKLIRKEGAQKHEEAVRDGNHFRELVTHHFGMDLPGEITYPLLTL